MSKSKKNHNKKNQTKERMVLSALAAATVMSYIALPPQPVQAGSSNSIIVSGTQQAEEMALTLGNSKISFDTEAQTKSGVINPSDIAQQGDSDNYLKASQYENKYVFSAVSGTAAASTGEPAKDENNNLAWGSGAGIPGGTAENPTKDSIAIGTNAKVYTSNSVAIGNGATDAQHTGNGNNVAIGNGAGTNGQNAVAIGSGAKASDDHAVAFGGDASATEGSIAIGGHVNANNTAIAIGSYDTDGTSTTSATGKHAVAIGYQTSANAAENALAIGTSANVSSNDGIAIGAHAQNVAGGVDGGVALGSYSAVDTDRTVGSNYNNYYVGYDPATGNAATNTSPVWKATKGAVSVGAWGDGNAEITRQITHVAAGTKDSDAVNVAQLKSLHDAMENAGKLAHDYSLIANPEENSNGKYTVDANGDVTLKVKDSVSGDTKDVTISGIGTGSGEGGSWNLTTNGDTANKTTIGKDATVDMSGAKDTVKVDKNGNPAKETGDEHQNITVTKTDKVDGTGTDVSYQLNDVLHVGTSKDNNKTITIDGQKGEITGLTNRTWTQYDYSNLTGAGDKPVNIYADSGKAVTEAQLRQALENLPEQIQITEGRGNWGGNPVKPAGADIKDLSNRSIAMGNGAVIYGGSGKENASDNIAMGGYATISTEHTNDLYTRQAEGNVVIGSYASAVGKNQGFIGYSNGQGYEKPDYDIDEATVIGMNAKSEMSYSTALGAHSLVSREDYIENGDKGVVNGIKDDAAVDGNMGVVSVGNSRGYEDLPDPERHGETGAYTRRIINVSRGQINEKSTDAINGSQLYRTVSSSIQYDRKDPNDKNILPLSPDDVNKNSITFEGDKYNSTTHEGGTELHNVAYADGKDGSQAVNVDLMKDYNAANDMSLQNGAETVSGLTVKDTVNGKENADVVSKGYKADDKGNVIMQVKDQNTDGQENIRNVVITDVASKAQQDTNTTNITKNTTDITNLGEKLEGAVMYNTTKNEDGTTTIDKSGVKLGGDEYSHTANTDGSVTTAGGTKITNVAYAQDSEGSAAVNVDKLKDYVDQNGGGSWNVTANGADSKEIKKGNTVDFTGANGVKVSKTDSDSGTNVTVGLDKDIVIGHDGKDGKPGEAGSIGLVGPAGKDGKDGFTTTIIKTETGTPGVDGKDGEDGITRIVYEDNTGKHEVATLDDGMKFKGDINDAQGVKLNKQVNIVGGQTDSTKLSDGANIGVVTGTTDADGNLQLDVKLAKELTGLESVTIGGAIDGKPGTGAVVINNDGINAGGKVITNAGTTTGTNVNDVVNVEYLNSQLKKASKTDYALINGTEELKPAEGNNKAVTGYKVKDDGTVELTVQDGTDPTKQTKVNIGGIATKAQQDENTTNITNLGEKLDGAVMYNTTKNEDGTTTIDKSGVKLGGDEYSHTANTDGSVTTAGGTKITNVAYAQDSEGSAAVNVDKLKDYVDQNGGGSWNVTANGADSKEIKKGNTVDFTGANGVKVSKTDSDNGTNVTVGLDKDIVIGHDGKDGQDGAAGSIGLVGPAGKDGKDGFTTTIIKTETGAPGVDGKDGEDGITRIVYEDNTGKHEVATLDDGMKFKGDDETVIAKKLNEQLDIKGGADSTKLTDDNIGVISGEDGALHVQLAKDIKGLDSLNIGGTADKDGNITGGINISKDGIDAGGKVITNAGTSTATSGTDVVNIDYLNSKLSGKSGTDYRLIANPEEGSEGKYTVNSRGELELTVQNGDKTDDRQTVTIGGIAVVYDKNGNLVSTNSVAQNGANTGVITLGKDAFATGADSMALGDGAGVYEKEGIALGNGAHAGNKGISIGYHANSNFEGGREGTIAIGNNTQSLGLYSTVIGTNSTVSGDLNTTYPTLLGGKHVQGAASTILGAQNTVDNGAGKVFAGVANSVAGAANTITDSNGVTIQGTGNTVTNAYQDMNLDSSDLLSIAGGDYSVLADKVSGAVAVIGGANTISDQTDSTIIGYGNTVKGDDGSGKTSSDIFTAGSKNTLTGVSNAVVLGNEVTMANVNDVISLGNQNSVGVSKAVALGSHTYVRAEGGVALGEGSEANVGKGVTGYLAPKGNQSTTWKSTAGAVSVGDQDMSRQITNVAAGTNDGDAVNVAQLKAVETMAKNAGTEWNLTTGGDEDNKATIGKGNTVDFTGANGVKVSKENTDTGAKVTVGLDKDIVIGTPGKDGEAGSIGLVGPAGKDGKDGFTTTIIKTETGAPGVDGKDGEDGITRIVYTTKDDNGNDVKHEVTTLDDGFGLTGDDGQTSVTQKLNKTIQVKGADGLTSTVKDDGNGNKHLEIGLGDKINVGDTGIVIGQQTVTGNGEGAKEESGKYVTGLSNTTWDKDNIVSGRAATEDQLQSAVSTINGNVDGKTFGLTDDNGNAITNTLDKTVSVKGANGITSTVKDDGNGNKHLEIGLGNELTVGGKDGADGAPGKDGSITIINKDGTQGTIGLNGKDGAPGVDGKDGITRIEYTTKDDNGNDIKHEVATLDDGMKFSGNNYNADDENTVINKKLNERLEIIGGGKDTNDDGTLVEYSDENLRTRVNEKGQLVLEMNKDIKANNITIGEPGKDGADGKDGSITIIHDNKETTITLNGKDGKPGLDGKDGVTRIEYADKDGNKQEVATLNDGLRFAGDNYKSGDTSTVAYRKLNEKLDITGGAKGELTDGNIGVIASNSGLEVKLAKDVDLGKDGSITIGGKPGTNSVVINNEGINAGNKVITNVADGVNKTDAVNKGQLDEVGNKVNSLDDFAVKYDQKKDENGNPVIDRNSVTLGGDTYNRVVDKDGSVTTTGGTKITNVAYADVKDANSGSQAVNVDLLKDQIAEAGNSAAKSDFYLREGKEDLGDKISGYKVDEKTGRVTLFVENDKGDKKEVNIGNIAAKSYVDNLNEGNVKYKVNSDGSIDYTSIVLGGGDNYQAYVSDGHKGGTHITNVAYATGKDGGEAVNVDYLNNAITNANTANKANEKHIDTTQEYSVKDNTVSLEEVDGDGKKTGNHVVIKDVASASDVGDISKIDPSLMNKPDENGNTNKTTVVDAVNNLNNKVGDLNYSSVKDDETEIADGDNTTTAIGKLDNKIDGINGKVEQAEKNHTTVTQGNGISVVDKGTPDKDGNISKHEYEVSLDDSFTLTGKDDKGQANGNSATVDGTNGKVSVTGKDGEGKEHTIVMNGQTGNVSGLANTTWDSKLADKEYYEGGYKNSTNAATESQLQQAMAGAVQYDRKDDGSIDTTHITLNSNGGSGTVINNVADGKVEEGSKEAVNGGQLWQTQQQVDNNSQNIDELSRSLGNLDRDTRKGIAGAAALAAMNPLDYDPEDKWNFTAGFGHYKGESAAAIGTYYQADENTMFNLGATIGNGDPLINVGATFKFGKSPKDRHTTTTSRAAMAYKIKELQEQNDMLIQKLNELSAKIDELSNKSGDFDSDNVFVPGGSNARADVKAQE